MNHCSTGDNEFTNYIRTWVAHKVSEIKNEDVTTLFGKQSKDRGGISALEKHMSICNMGNMKPLMNEDKAFWQIV